MLQLRRIDLKSGLIIFYKKNPNVEDKNLTICVEYVLLFLEENCIIIRCHKVDEILNIYYWSLLSLYSVNNYGFKFSL